MNDLKKRIYSYALIFYWVLVFGVSTVLLFLILPGEPKFKYEYQKGFPWQHENLVAPFDFAILKSDAEIASERAEIMNSVVPYFLFDTTLLKRNITKLAIDFRITEEPINQEKIKFYNTLKKNLTEIYTAGILQRSIETYDELKGKNEIKKRIGSMVTSIPVSSLYSEKSAYNKIHDIIQERIKSNLDLKM